MARLHERQGRQLLREMDVRIPRGAVAATPREEGGSAERSRANRGMVDLSLPGKSSSLLLSERCFRLINR